MAASFLRPGLFAGRTAVVTGGGTGIGRAISAELLALVSQSVKRLYSTLLWRRVQRNTRNKFPLPPTLGNWMMLTVLTLTSVIGRMKK